MKEVQIKDKHRNFLRLFEVNGFLISLTNWFPQLRTVQSLDLPSGEQFFEDDILLCSYPRSGYNWTWECLNMLTHNTTKISDLSTVDTNIEASAILNSNKCFEQNPPRILHTHLPIHLIPLRFLKMKIIFLYRNPKDAVHSWYRIVKETADPPYNGTFDDYVELFLEGKVPAGSWFDYMTAFEKYIEENNICVSPYEERAKDPVGNLKRLAQYVGVDVTDDFIRRVSEATKLNIMIREKPQHGEFAKQVFDEKSLEKKGKVGGWTEHFSVAMNEKFDKVFKDKMRDSKLLFTFTF